MGHCGPLWARGGPCGPFLGPFGPLWAIVGPFRHIHVQSTGHRAALEDFARIVRCKSKLACVCLTTLAEHRGSAAPARAGYVLFFTVSAQRTHGVTHARRPDIHTLIRCQPHAYARVHISNVTHVLFFLSTDSERVVACLAFGSAVRQRRGALLGWSFVDRNSAPRRSETC